MPAESDAELASEAALTSACAERVTTSVAVAVSVADLGMAGDAVAESDATAVSAPARVNSWALRATASTALAVSAAARDLA